jgi:hypothetical protein
MPRGRIFRFWDLSCCLLLISPHAAGWDGLLPRTLIEALVVMRSSGESACGSGNRCTSRE